MSHYVYKYVYNNEIIYIGKTDTNLIRRLKEHCKSGDNIDSKYWDKINKSDIYYCYANNKIMSDVIESELIRRYKPICNKAKMSDWSGIEFVEPKWYFFDKNIMNEVKTIKKTIKKTKTTYKTTKKVQELKQQVYSLNLELITKKYKFEREIEEMKKEIKDLKFYKKIFDERRDQVKKFCIKQDICGNVYDVESVYKDYLTYSDIINIYKSTEQDINYISTAYDEKQKLICKKIIYTDEYDNLIYEFQNSYKNRENGDVIFRKGIIYRSRDATTYYYKDTYKTLRFWDRIGSAFYKEIQKEDIKRNGYRNKKT